MFHDGRALTRTSITSHHITSYSCLLALLLFEMHMKHSYLFCIHSSVKSTCLCLKLKIKMETEVFGKKCVFEKRLGHFRSCTFTYSHTMYTRSFVISLHLRSFVNEVCSVFSWSSSTTSPIPKKKPNALAQISISAS